MKNLFNRHSAGGGRFVFFGAETPGGNETDEYSIANDAEAQALSREISTDEVDAMVDGISNSLENGLTDTNKDAVKAKIQEIIATMGEDEPLYVFLTQTLEGQLEDFLQGDLNIKGANLDFDFERQDAPSAQASSSVETSFVVNFDAIEPFDLDYEGNPKQDDLQNFLDIETEYNVNGKQKMLRGFVDPEKGVVDPDGNQIEGFEDVSLANLIREDLCHGGIQNKIPNPTDLLEAIQEFNPKTSITPEQVTLIVQAMTGTLPEMKSKTVGELQDALSNISEDFKKVIAGRDEKYGRGTRNGFRMTGAMLEQVTVVHRLKEEKKNFNVTFEVSMENLPGRILEYQKYEEVLIVADHSGSMGNDIHKLGTTIMSGFAHKNLKDVQFSFAEFESTARLLTELSEGEKEVEDMVNAMQHLHIRGGDERGVDAAIQMLNTPGAFSDDTDRIANREDLPRRLMEIVTDEPLQDVSKAELRELRRLADEKNVDIVFVFSMNDNGTTVQKVPLSVLESMYGTGAEESDDLQALEEQKQSAESHLAELSSKMNEITIVNDVSKMTSHSEDTEFQTMQAEYKEADSHLAELSSKIDAIIIANDVSKMTSHSEDTEFQTMQAEYREVEARLVELSSQIEDIDLRLKQTQDQAERQRLIQERADLLAEGIVDENTSIYIKKHPKDYTNKTLEDISAWNGDYTQADQIESQIASITKRNNSINAFNIGINQAIAHRDATHYFDDQLMAYVPKPTETGPLDSVGRQTMLAKQKTGN